MPLLTLAISVWLTHVEVNTKIRTYIHKNIQVHNSIFTPNKMNVCALKDTFLQLNTDVSLINTGSFLYDNYHFHVPPHLWVFGYVDYVNKTYSRQVVAVLNCEIK